jgi:predicted nucleic acid-binding protein
VIVVDACAWLSALVVGGSQADEVRATLASDPRWVAPAHMPLEVLRSLRRGVGLGHITRSQAARTASAVSMTRLELVSPGAKVLSRVWTLRDNLSVYDAPYVAIAEAFGAPLVTVDLKLARAARVEGVSVVVPGVAP